MNKLRATLQATISVALTLAFLGGAQAGQIQSASSTLGGSAIDFEGMTEGQLISNQYPGILFSQIDGGTPMIDNSPFLYAYNASSGTGVLTGSTTGGAQFPTVAGLKLTLINAGSALEFWLGDTAPLGVYTIAAYDALDNLIDSFMASPGHFVGFTGLSGLKWVTVDSSVENDAFAIDDVRFRVPEPASIALLGLALAGLRISRRAKKA